MATDVTPDARTDGLKTSGATSLAWNHTLTAGMTNPWLLGNGTSGSGTAVNLSNIQWDAAGGSPQSLINKIRDGEPNGNCKSEIWGVSPIATGTKQVKITPPSSVEITGGSASYQYVNQTTPYNAASGQSNKAVTGTTASLTVTSATHEMTVTCAAENGGTALTVTAGQTTIHNENIGAGQHAGASSDKAGAATVAHSYTNIASGNPWVIVGVSLQFDGGSAAVAVQHRIIQGSMPGASRAMAFPSAPVIFGRPAVRGSLVTGLPRKIIKAGLPLAMWAGWTGWPAVYGKADLERPAIRGALVTGAPRHIIKPAGVPLNAFALATWPTVYGTADLYRPAIRGQLVAGPPRRTLTARAPIVRPWMGGASILRPKLGVGAIITGAPRRTILAAIPRQRPWAGGATLASPAIGIVAQPTGASRHTTFAAVAIRRPWFGGARTVRPSVRGPLVTGGPRIARLAAVPILRMWPGEPRWVHPRLGGLAPTVGRPHGVHVVGLPLVRPWIGFASLNRPAVRGPVTFPPPKETKLFLRHRGDVRFYRRGN